MSKFLYLDCTLRDGGQLFEQHALDKTFHKHNRFFFDRKFKLNLIEMLSNTFVDIIELGVIEECSVSNHLYSLYESIHEIHKLDILKRDVNIDYSVLFKGPNVNFDSIPYCDHLISLARVVIRYSMIKESVDLLEHLTLKGYKVSFQPMITNRYNDEELAYLISEANRMCAYAFYIVDSHGYMDLKEFETLLSKVDALLNSDIKIGIHLHDNNGLALSKIEFLVSSNHNRIFILDSSIYGLGLGSGNCKTEEVLFLTKKFSDLDSIEMTKMCNLLSSLSLVEAFWTKNIWGYNPLDLIASYHKVSYKITNYLSKELGLSYYEIFIALFRLPKSEKYELNSNLLRKLVT